MSKRVWVVVAAVAVVLVMSVIYIVSTYRDAGYEDQLVEIWSNANANLRSLDQMVVQTKCDFSDVGTTAAKLYLNFTTAKQHLNAITPPGRYRKFQLNMADYFDKSADLSNAIKASCDGWTNANFLSHQTAIAVLNKTRTDCYNSWRGKRNLEQTTDVFTALPSRFNSMRDERRKGPEIDSGGTVTPTFPRIAGIEDLGPESAGLYDSATIRYLNQAKSLIVSYKQLRGDLEDTIQWIKSHPGQTTDAVVTSRINDALAARCSIRNEMLGMYVPTSWSYCHNQAVGCVNRGIEAIEKLRSGDYPSFSALSHQNTPILAEVMRAYGLS